MSTATADPVIEIDSAIDALSEAQAKALTAWRKLVIDLAGGKVRFDAKTANQLCGSAGLTLADLQAAVGRVKARFDAAARITAAETQRPRLVKLEADANKGREGWQLAQTAAKKLVDDARKAWQDATATASQLQHEIDDTISESRSLLRRTADPSVIAELQALKAQRSQMQAPFANFVPQSVEGLGGPQFDAAVAENARRESASNQAIVDHETEAARLDQRIAELETQLLNPACCEV